MCDSSGLVCRSSGDSAEIWCIAFSRATWKDTCSLAGRWSTGEAGRWTGLARGDGIAACAFRNDMRWRRSASKEDCLLVLAASVTSPFETAPSRFNRNHATPARMTGSAIVSSCLGDIVRRLCTLWESPAAFPGFLTTSFLLMVTRNLPQGKRAGKGHSRFSPDGEWLFLSKATGDDGEIRKSA